MSTKYSAAEKTVIITGGNTGLGYQCARNLALAGQNWQIIIASRDSGRTSAAVERLKTETAYPHIQAMSLNLAFLKSVRQFAGEFVGQPFPPLRAIVCNAGSQFVSGTSYTEDGFEATFGTNHLGHYLLVNLLLARLVAPARVVFVSSGTHDPKQRTGMPDPQYTTAKELAYPTPEKDAKENPGRLGRVRYTTSKLCNLYCTYELNRRLQKEGISSTAAPITVNAFDPGFIPGTGLARDYNSTSRFIARNILPLFVPLLRLAGMNVSTVQNSGKALASLVLNPTLANITGKYFEGTKEIASSSESYNEQKAFELWEGSRELLNISQEETIFRLKVPK